MTTAGLLLATLTLAAPFKDGAILQRDRTVPVWGTAEPGETVTVSFAGQTQSTVAEASGAWRADLKPMGASREPREMTVVASQSGDATVRDVLVGEVWFASGQSNMVCPITGADPHFSDVDGALVSQFVSRDDIRFVLTPEVWRVAPTNDANVRWQKFSPASFTGEGPKLSAVAWYFARELNAALDVPVGIVDSAWGGSAIDAWIPREALAARADLRDIYELPVKENWTGKDRYGPIIDNMMQPTVLWNAMVNPFVPYAMRGVIWYQGERNRAEPAKYVSKMHALYDGWSARFENPGMPFYFVQLANYKYNWFGQWLAQARFAKEEPHAAMVVSADLGVWDDIHPPRKEPVARRLAALALRRDYGFDLVADSPEVASWKTENGRMVLEMANARRLFVHNDSVSSFSAPFELAGADGVFRQAKIENYRHFTEKGVDRRYGDFDGARIVLSAEGVAEPVKARYLFKAPRRSCVFNEAGLPLGAFQIGAPELDDFLKEE